MSGTPTADWPYPFWIAHRGAGRLAPENTLAAFREGARHGYRAFECDVKLSGDGVPFLLHDATLDRTTPERGRAADRAWSELSRLDAGGWHSRAYAGEPPASLASIARFVVDNGFALDIEIKPTPGTEEPTGAAIAQAVNRLWSGNAPPLLSSFQAQALAAARDAAPSLPRALLLDALRTGWLDEARSLGCVAVITAYPLMERAVVDALHAAGLRALVYPVNDPASAAMLIDAGVDAIVTDAVDRFSPAAHA
jgi:glycerophosphoryl diester phosphodiesterase